MRGVASLMVVFFHLDSAMGEAFAWLPAWFRSVFHEGVWGVHVFFLLSGYVIALSTERLAPGLRSFGAFALRRGVRLDPPYLASIVVVLVLAALAGRFFPDHANPMPSVGALLSHVVYLQEILGYPHVVSIYWSLCYEVQMYSFYVLLMFACSTIARPERGGDAWNRVWQFALVWIPLFAYSWLAHFTPWTVSVRGLATPYWFLFSLGALIRWMHVDRASRALVLSCAVAAVAGGFYRAMGEGLFILLTTVLLWDLHTSRVAQWIGASRSLMFLGRLSYSLYLFHPIIGWRTISALRVLGPSEPSPILSIVYFLAGIATSILSAYVAYLLLEKPAMSLSRRVTLPRRAAPATA